MLEWVQFHTNQKKKLREIAKSRGFSLNTLMVLIVDEYLKGFENEKK